MKQGQHGRFVVAGLTAIKFPEHFIDMFLQVPTRIRIGSCVCRLVLRQQVLAQFKKRKDLDPIPDCFVETDMIDQVCNQR